MIKPNDEHFAFVLCLLLLIFVIQISWSYKQYSDSIIKDRNFYRYLKKEYNIKGSIEPDDVDSIYSLNIDCNRNISNLEGIQYFKELKDLMVMEGNKIEDYSALKELSNLEDMSIWRCNIDKIEEIGTMESLKCLDIVYPKGGKFDSLENFPNLHTLIIQGMDFQNLQGLQGSPKLKSLCIGDGKVISFDGIENFSELEKLKFYKLVAKDVSSIFKLKNVKLINVQGGYIENGKEFLEWIEENDIYTNEKSNLKKVFKLE